MPMIFSPELPGESCHISYKAEMVEVGWGKRIDAFQGNGKRCLCHCHSVLDVYFID